MSKSANPIIKAADIDPSLVPQTRVTHWRSLTTNGPHIFIKHEDECNFAITAGKSRKYASLLPWLQFNRIETVHLIGSANSNHIVAACQLLLQHGIKPVPVLKKGHSKGSNQALLRLLVDENEWIIVPRSQWKSTVGAFPFPQNSLQTQNPASRTKVLAEGACDPAALPGAMTLAADILRNQVTLGIEFSDVFIDAGTCLSAAALGMGMAELGMEARLHITLMAETEVGFWERASVFDEWYTSIFQKPAQDWKSKVFLHRPIFGASYGSVNAQVIAAIQKYARRGLLTDPIYSAKHMSTAENIVEKSEFEMGNVLVVHSGGAQSLAGFEHLLWKQP